MEPFRMELAFAIATASKSRYEDPSGSPPRWGDSCCCCFCSCCRADSGDIKAPCLDTLVTEPSWFDITVWAAIPRSKVRDSFGRIELPERSWVEVLRRREVIFITLRRKKDLAPSNDPIGVSGGSVLDDRMDRSSLPGDPSPRGGGSSPTSASDAMVAAPVQILVGAK